MRSVVVAFLASAIIFGQSAPPSCPGDHPVDDIISEMHNQQSKRKNRNKNPLPEVICIFGWCRDVRTPHTLPQPVPRPPTGSDESASSSSTTNSSAPVEPCDVAVEKALDAAHNVDVGDYYFGEKNYNAALLRYRDALEEKPNDSAIHVRLGRVLEKLNQVPDAIEQYKAAQKIAGPKKWSDEADSSLARLQGAPAS